MFSRVREWYCYMCGENAREVYDGVVSDTGWTYSTTNLAVMTGRLLLKVRLIFLVKQMKSPPPEIWSGLSCNQ